MSLKFIVSFSFGKDALSSHLINLHFVQMYVPGQGFTK